MSFTPTQYSPPNHRINNNATSISSVDEEVPRPRFNIDNAATSIPPQAVVESQVVRTVERKPSISSLNPSASRFTLKLPLLGRPKIPLEQAVAVAQAEDIRDPPKSAENAPHDQDSVVILGDGPPTSVANGGTASETPAAAAEGEAGPLSSPQPEPSANAPESVNTEHNAHEPRSASWWDYIGWGGSTADGQNKLSEDSQAPTNQQDTAPAPTLTSPVADTAQGREGSGATAVSEPDRTSDTKEPASPTQPVAASDAQTQQSAAKPSSVFSSETVKSHGSAWYSPWAWYTTSPTTTTSAQGETAAAADEGSLGENENAKTESEMVKEEALARDQNTQTGVSAEPVKASSPSEAPADNAAPKTPLASPESLNPVESSIANNKSGWMSFLMSKALTVKSVTNESHEQQDDAMEVMDVDDAPEPSEAIAIPTGNDVQRAGAAALLKSAASPSACSPVPPSTSKSPTGKSPTAPPPKEREPRKSDPPAAPLTDNESIKRDTTKGSSTRDPSPTPSKTSGTTPPNSARTTTPNFVLPTWEDTFHSPPRSYVPPRNHGAKSKLTGALSYVAGALFKDDRAHGKSKGKGKEREVEGPAPEFLTFGQELPKAFDVLGEQLNPYMLNGGCRVVVIGVAGWSPGAVTRTLAGGLPSSSSKFVNMTAQALEQFADEHGFKFKKITRMPLEGDGTIRKKVSRVYNHLVNNEEWMEDLHAADVIFVASHSQGAIISTHLVDRLIEDGHILTARSVDVLAKSAASITAGGAAAVPATQAQKVCLLALCGIHLGPLRYLKTSSLLQPYIQYVENAAARELFEFQDTESKLSKNYIGALRNVMDHGAKVVYIASLNDQVVPIYSGLFTAASHPRILRALYIDNDAYHSSDFLSNLLILLIRIMNAGLSDRGLLAHLSEATAGTLSGVGHSTAYEELATYSLAVKYFFMTNDGTNADAELVINPFNAVEEQNDYEIPWLLRDMIADTKVAHFFAREFSQLRDAFDDWQPKTTILRDVKKKLQPITRLSTVQLPSASISKL
ncbi:hypothetical protein C8Q77DRAFT_1058430 [Trametes polyzona]|nr:hypothetical protein C8Q77DRAFT_1058430 [Trametes polyzona]